LTCSLRFATSPAALPTDLTTVWGFGTLTCGSERLGLFSFGVGIRERGPRLFLLRVSATPPANPAMATPPASAGPFAFSAIVAIFDLVSFLGVRRFDPCDDRLRAGWRERELEPELPRFLVEPVLVPDFVEPLLLLPVLVEAFDEPPLERWLLAFFAADDLPERELLVLVAAMASSFESFPLTGLLLGLPATPGAKRGSAQNPCNSQGPAGGSSPLPSGRTRPLVIRRAETALPAAGASTVGPATWTARTPSESNPKGLEPMAGTPSSVSGRSGT
jgi:hypothetical protein